VKETAPDRRQRTIMADPVPDNFPAAVQIVLEEEGVFSDQANDPGGQTYYGIARASHLKVPWPPTKDQAIAIYRTEFWDAHRCGEMPWAWALAMFDSYCNQGTATAIWAQSALRVLMDGVIGPGTIVAMKSAPSDDLRQFLALRAKAYVSAAGFSTYGLGWFARLFRIAQAGALPP
jgi:lysozyme family protein